MKYCQNCMRQFQQGTRCPICGSLLIDQPQGGGKPPKSDNKMLLTILIVVVFFVVTAAIVVVGVLLLNKQSGDSGQEETVQTAEVTPTERPTIIYDDEVFDDLGDVENVVEVESIGGNASEGNASGGSTAESGSQSDPKHPSFYGIWDLETDDLSEANARAEKIEKQGMPSYVIETSQWSGLSEMKAYAVTIGKYATQEKADARLQRVQSMGYPDTEVRYTGSYQGK
ncbi:MAG: SPOR domain-containing protein [Eubacteriales bacterium]|nr:SPOR domain-containing protein [Eubacteriales bacterium]